MDTQEKMKSVNKGYGLALYMPEEFKKAFKIKLDELSKTSSDKERWQAISKGFDIGIAERTQDRIQKLEHAKKSRGRTQGRTR